MGNSRAAKLPKDARVVCPDCRGRRTLEGMALDKCNVSNCETHVPCWECHHGSGPCYEHTCPRCQGTGLVCPVCRGDRLIQLHPWTQARPIVKYERCDGCCEGNQVNPAKEQKMIERWLQTHGGGPQQLQVVK